MEEVDLEEAIARLKLCMSMSLHGGEQTIVNIKDLEKILKVHQELQEEFFWEQVRITNEYIPKSKVKEKIGELARGKNDDWNNEYFVEGRKKEAKIQVLQELLEEE